MSDDRTDHRDDERTEDERLEVWLTPDRTRFYLVPAGLHLPPGDAVVRGPLGIRRRRVDLAAMEAWEVPRAEAMAAIDARVGDAVGNVRGVLGRLVDAGREVSGLGSTGHGVDDIPELRPEDLVGVSASELVTEPEARRKALSGLLERAAGAAERLGVQAPDDPLGDLERGVNDLVDGVRRAVAPRAPEADAPLEPEVVDEPPVGEAESNEPEAEPPVEGGTDDAQEVGGGRKRRDL